MGVLEGSCEACAELREEREVKNIPPPIVLSKIHHFPTHNHTCSPLDKVKNIRRQASLREMGQRVHMFKVEQGGKNSYFNAKTLPWKMYLPIFCLVIADLPSQFKWVTPPERPSPSPRPCGTPVVPPDETLYR